MHTRRLMLAVGCAVAAVAGTAAPAQAATNPYTPGEVCGSGYRTVSGGTFTISGTSGAKMYVMYNASSGRNCVAVIKTTNIGKATPTGAGLKLSGTPWQEGVNWEAGNFKYYAESPTKYYAKGKCIDVYGWSGGASTAFFRSDVFCGG